MALAATEVMRNGFVRTATNGALVVTNSAPVAVVHGLPVDADGRLAVAS